MLFFHRLFRSIRAIATPTDIPFKRLSSSRGGFVLAAALGLVIIMGILFSGVFIQMLAQLQESDMRISAHESFYLAESGIERALYELRINSDFRAVAADGTAIDDQEVRYDPADPATRVGTYDLQVITVPVLPGELQLVDVRSDGISDRLPAVRKTLLVRMIAISPTQFFTSSLGNIRIGAGSNFSGDLLARDLIFSPSAASGFSINVNGNAFYMRDIIGANPAKVNITGNQTLSPAITFAGVDLVRYEDLAISGGKHVSGNYTINGDFDKTSLNSSNGVVFVDGDITINGAYDDSLLIVATGDIIINGDLLNNDNPGNPGAAGNAQIGLFAAGNVKIAGAAPSNLDVEAFVVADEGTFEAQGAPGTKGQLNFTGAISVRGSTDLNDPNATGVDLNAYASRNYTYNTQLSADNQIPFLPSIANIVVWSEINPNDTSPIAALP